MHIMCSIRFKLTWYGRMECNTEENFSVEWNTEWKFFSMKWKKIASMGYAKVVFHSIPYHTLPVARLDLKLPFE